MTTMDDGDESCREPVRSVNINCLFTYLFYVSFYITFDILEMCGFFFLIQGQSNFRFQLVDKLCEAHIWYQIVT